MLGANGAYSLCCGGLKEASLSACYVSSRLMKLVVDGHSRPLD